MICQLYDIFSYYVIYLENYEYRISRNVLTKVMDNDPIRSPNLFNIRFQPNDTFYVAEF